MRLFLSYASNQAAVADAVALALAAEGHDVFHDRASLPSGEGYHARIREAVAGADLFVFLVSPDSVAAGRYTLTELDFAREKWRHPSGRVLPVVVAPTERGAIPEYLRAVTLLEPGGNVPAAVAAAVARLAAPPWRRFLGRSAALLVLVALVGAGLAVRWFMAERARARETAALVESAQLQQRSQSYPAAWDTFARASALSPSDAAVASGQARLAMDWLENIRVTSGQGTFTAIVEQVEPVLVRCAGSSEAVRAADCLAHLGWAAFLRSRERGGGLDPVEHYRRALDRDAGNAYAHAMWGFETLRSGGTVDAARAHFEQALASGRERAYVRQLQMAALLWRRDPALEEELVRVANDMRTKGERSDFSRLWNVYYDRVLNRYETGRFLSALVPADHLATFRWLFPDASVPGARRLHHLFVLGTLQEHADLRADALSTFRTIRDSMAQDGTLDDGGPLPDGTIAALARLER